LVAHPKSIGNSSLSKSEQTIELAGCGQLPRVVVAADRPPIDKDLRHGPPSRELFHFGAARRILGHIDLFKNDIFRAQQRLRRRAVWAISGDIDHDFHHISFTSESAIDPERPIGPVQLQADADFAISMA